MKIIKALNYLVLLTAVISCSSAYNYPEAEGITNNGKSFIKLKGKRDLSAHDIVSLFSGKTYVDSILIPVSSFEDGIIKGKDIVVERGRYKYLGEISIYGDKLRVNLLYNNTDDKTEEPTSWNGEYRLIRN